MNDSKRSPVPKKISDLPEEIHDVEQLSFPDAVRELLNGHRITRLEWKSVDCWTELKDGYLKIFLRGEVHNWIVSDGDLMAIDWVVISQKN